HDTPGLDYIDKTKIGAAGYSAGGNAVLQSASHFGARKAKALKAAKARGNGGRPTDMDAVTTNAQAQNKITAIFVGGYVLTMTDGVLDQVDSNVGMDYACYDEGAFRTEKHSAQMRDAPEALRLVNSTMAKAAQVSEVELGKVYGDYSNRTMRVVHNT